MLNKTCLLAMIGGAAAFNAPMVRFLAILACAVVEIRCCSVLQPRGM